MFWTWGTQGILRRESSSPNFTRKGNPQRFPFHTFPSLRGGGAAGMDGGVLFILEYGNAYPLQGESSSPDFTRKGNPQRFPFHTFPSLRGGGAAGMDGGALFILEQGNTGWFAQGLQTARMLLSFWRIPWYTGGNLMPFCAGNGGIFHLQPKRNR